MRLFAATFGKVLSNRLYPIPEIFCNEKVTRDCRAGHAVSIGPGPLKHLWKNSRVLQTSSQGVSEIPRLLETSPRLDPEVGLPAFLCLAVAH